MADLIDRNISIKDALMVSRFQGLNSRNPKLVCHETRNKRDMCLVQHGLCNYLVEDHFRCLEGYYKKEKVHKLREAFRSQSLSMVEKMPNPTGDLFQQM
mmetsp:Transcript_145478/g.253913  ORF Transcript_145478/g.253913 Transcript_145478/m.253913 type:complete len:99 (-) Transcript_145478:277-573(-)